MNNLKIEIAEPGYAKSMASEIRKRIEKMLKNPMPIRPRIVNDFFPLSSNHELVDNDEIYCKRFWRIRKR